MARGKRVLIKLVSMAETGYFYVTQKNRLNTTQKLRLMKYDPIVRQHVLFREEKMSRTRIVQKRR
eukprot:TRINITY_DN19612_c0_g1_i2.p1 TRINITY_DN19612_c0_g1~~TRINITY_DN19612_c0_g1_i2.p1  ORF type:complete len:65 (+),score=6.63 TRINITY_DN19612_c0_g1_i2:68-262(+)